MLGRRVSRILLVGVGGQGVLTAARVLGDAAFDAGFDVSVSQLHGMSQRGGSVEAQVLVGRGAGAGIGPGEADLVVALEPIEALRAVPRMSMSTSVLVHLGRVVPFTLTLAGGVYPDGAAILAELRAASGEVRAVGPARDGASVFMLGALAQSGWSPFPGERIHEALRRRTPPERARATEALFALGRQSLAAATRTAPTPELPGQ